MKAVSRLRPRRLSPVFEKMNQELLKNCARAVETAKDAIETSRKLTQEAQDLLEARKRQQRD